MILSSVDSIKDCVKSFFFVGTLEFATTFGDFAISPIEADIIKKHMWPLNIKPPRYREAMIVTIADKICSTKEVFGKPIYNQKVEEILNEYQ